MNDPGAPDYTAMGRNDLIAYCRQLRAVLLSANPLDWASGGDMGLARAWELRAVRALSGPKSTPDKVD